MIREQEDLRFTASQTERLQQAHAAMKERFQEMEARYRALFERSLYGIYLHDPEGNFLDANEAALRLLGYTKEEFLSLNLQSVLGATQARDAYSRISEILNQGAAKETREYSLRTKDGNTLWVEVDVSLIYREGRPYAIQGVAKNITLSKQAKQALRESEQKYRTLFEQSVDAVYITSREGTFLDANPALLDLFGYTREELLGGFNVRQLYCDPRGRDAFQEQIEERGFLRNYPVTFRRKDGTEIDCLLTSSVRRSEDGTMQGYQGIIRDVTEQKKAEKALQDREAHYRAMVEAFDGLIYICSRDYRVEFMNQRFIDRTGYDATGELCYKAIHNLDTVCPWCVNERIFKGETVRWEVLSPKDNRWLYVVNTPIFHADGTMSKQALILDITDRKKMEQDLQESTERLKFFAYSVSHDLKGPAIGAYGFAKRLSERYRDSLDETGRLYCDQIAAASEQIGALVDQINLFIASKELPLNIETIDVKEILDRVREDFSPQLQVRQIDWQEPDRIPPLNADRLALSRILRNLVDNALKYGGTALSHIYIGYCEEEDRHLLFVEDNGPGIKGDDAQKIFGVFMRRKDSKGVQGTGLGLAIVKEMAEQHGGRAWVEPGAKGGSTFYVSISKDLSPGHGQCPPDRDDKGETGQGRPDTPQVRKPPVRSSPQGSGENHCANSR
ncbi:MAG: PAS domain-containing sensor histidine kinase [Deltaproteobacteria bacterium]|nr:PAS domain-containing sensor histidine kinase [Deltaproteobacteria bacterium]